MVEDSAGAGPGGDIHVVALAGSGRVGSLRNALSSLAPLPDGDIVLIVDDPDDDPISDDRRDPLLAQLAPGFATVAAYPVSDTVKWTDAAGLLVSTMDRALLRRRTGMSAFVAGDLQRVCLAADDDDDDEIAAADAAGIALRTVDIRDCVPTAGAGMPAPGGR
ncbi:MAG: 2-C-methyl-D-erythritol 4-phosphate cytidylyltransferase [Mycobacteriales bacterium]